MSHTFQLLSGTKAVLETKSYSSVSSDANYLPPNVILFETDTGSMKITTSASSTYLELPYVIDKTFTSTFKGYIDRANTANGVLKLGAGQIDSSYIPAVIAGDPVVTATIATRDQLTDDQKRNVIIVKDASADLHVDASLADVGTLKLLMHFNNSPYDSSSFHHTSTQNGAITGVTLYSETIKLFGRSSRYFNGTNHAITISGADILTYGANDAFSMHLAVSPATLPASGTRTILWSNQLQIAVDSAGALTALYGNYDASPRSASLGTCSVGTFSRLTISRDTAGNVHFRNNEALTGTLTEGALAMSNSGFFLGVNGASAAGTYFNGYIDELFVVGGADMYGATPTPLPEEAWSSQAATAFYVWDADAEDFIMIGSAQSMDIDFSTFVTEGNTLSRLAYEDGVYSQFTVSRRGLLQTLVTNYATLESTEGANYTTLAGRFDAIDGRQSTIDSSLTTDAGRISTLNANLLKSSVQNTLLAATADQWT